MALLDTLQGKYGKDFHPAMLLAQVIEDASQDIKLRVDCAKSLMPYVEAAHKSIDLRANINSNVGLLRVRFEDAMSTEEGEEESAEG